MKTMLTKKRLLASLLAVAVLMSALVCFTIPAHAEGEPVNLRENVAEVKGILEDLTSGAIDESDRFDATSCAAMIDGDLETQKYVGGAKDWNPAKNVGVRMKLDAVYNVAKVVLHSAQSGYAETLEVYASDKLIDLYSEMNLVDTVECADHATPVEVEVGRNALYVGIINTTGDWRAYEFEIYGSDALPDDNLKANVTEVKGLLKDINSGAIDENDRFDATSCAAMIDGDYETQKFVAGATDWNPPKYLGVRMTLDAVYNVEKLILYSGQTGYEETLKVYASDKLIDLYSEMNLVDTVECAGKQAPQAVTIGRNAKYVAIINETGAWRAYEFEIHGSEALPSTNLIENIEETKGLVQFVGTGAVSEEANPVTNDNAAAIFDGEFEQVFMGNPMEWDPARYSGVRAKLDDVYAVEKLVLYSGDTGHTDTMKVYAAETLDDLYKAESLIAEGIECEKVGEPEAITVGKNVQYVAIFNTSGEWRPYEFEIYGTAASDDESSEDETSDGETSDGETSDGETSDGETSDGETSDGETSDGETSDGETSDGETSDGETSDGETSDGETSDGETSDGETSDDETPPSSLLTGSAISKVEAIAQPVGNDWWTQPAGDLMSDEDAATLFDGNYENQVYVRSALEWETPLYAGVSIKLDQPYYVDKIVLYSGDSGISDTVRVHATMNDCIYPPSDALSSSVVAEDIVCVDKSQPVTIEIGKEVQYLAIFSTSGEWRPYEIEIHKGADDDETSDVAENLLPGLGEPIKIGVTTGTDYDAAGETGGNLDNLGLNDGIITDTETGKKQDVQFWNGKAPGSKFVFIYDLGKNYDLSEVAVYAREDYIHTDEETGEEFHQGIEFWDFYASTDRGDLFNEDNKVSGKTGYDDPADVTIDVSYDKVRYVALIVGIQDEAYGACRLSEWEVYGVESAEQDTDDGPVVTPDNHENILLGMAPDIFGVTAGTDYETLDGTDGPYGYAGLTDGTVIGSKEDVGDVGKEQNVQFWQGKAEDGSLKKFVFTYDLGKNYDLSKVYVDAWANYEDEGVNQGIESWDFYASRNREDLFKAENKIAGKTGYADPSELAKALSLKQIRYVSFVFTIQDTRYGTCRLTELELYGAESAEQDADKPVEVLDEYRDLTAENDVVVRIHGLDETDDLTLLDIEAVVEKITSAADLSAVAEKLDGRYVVKGLFKVSLTDSDGYEVELEGREISLLIPVDSEDYLAAVVDAAGADLLNVQFVDDYMLIDVVNNGTYALLSTSGTQGGTPDESDPDESTPDESDPDASTPDESDPSNPDTGVNGAAGFAALAVLSAAVLFVSKKAKKN